MNVGVVITTILLTRDLVIVETIGPLIPLLKKALLKAFRIENKENPRIGPLGNRVS